MFDRNCYGFGAKTKLTLAQFFIVLSLCVVGPKLGRAQDRPDIVAADFEGESYGGWTVTGDAFGNAPAKGKLKGQMEVTGYLGKGLVNSFSGGDTSIGTLTSPPFVVARPYLNFLIGGGAYQGETCMNLRLDGKIVQTATGPNDKPGGNERLEWSSWDVSPWMGKNVVIEIVDKNRGGWGHINVDQIVQSDRKRGMSLVHRTLTLDSKYLHLPVQNSAPLRRVKMMVDGRIVRDLDIKLAETKTDFVVASEVAEFLGKAVRLEAHLPGDSQSLERIAQSNVYPGESEHYQEKLRPQFHFTSRRGWLNDPNGLVWHEGEYHLFYQHNPYGWDWGNMHWGHAASRDLVHWRELGDVLRPKEYGDWCFSGSAVVDATNTSGLGKGDAAPIVAAFTSTGRGECIIYSNDRGRSFQEIAGNPVVKHAGRDPRLLWHAATKRWVMAVYDEEKGKRAIAFHSSLDLKTWKFESKIDDFYECPDIFELTVEGEPSKSYWVIYAADGQYMLGKFDGHAFVPESSKKERLWYGNFYAAQTFSNVPDARRIQVGWGNGITFPAMPFNQQMTVPCVLTLRKTPDGMKMFANPVAELSSLRAKSYAWRDLDAKSVDGVLGKLRGDLYEIRAEVQLGEKGTFRLNVRGVDVAYAGSKQTLVCGKTSAPMRSIDGVIRLQILVDRGSIEVFGNDGRVAISQGMIPAEKEHSLYIELNGEGSKLRMLEAEELNSAWR